MRRGLCILEQSMHGHAEARRGRANTQDSCSCGRFQLVVPMNAWVALCFLA